MDIISWVDRPRALPVSSAHLRTDAAELPNDTSKALSISAASDAALNDAAPNATTGAVIASDMTVPILAILAPTSANVFWVSFSSFCAALIPLMKDAAWRRSEERRVGKEGVSTFRSRWSQYTK